MNGGAAFWIAWVCAFILMLTYWPGETKKFVREVYKVYAKFWYVLRGALPSQLRFKSATQKHCELLHKTAKQEIELWGSIQSLTVADHLAECNQTDIVHAMWARHAIKTLRVVEEPEQVDVDIAQRKHCKKYGHQWKMNGECAFCPKIKKTARV